MTIPEIKLTQKEMCIAVSNYLAIHGIACPVENVEKNYTGGGAFRITLKEPEEPTEEVEQVTPTAAPV